MKRLFANIRDELKEGKSLVLCSVIASKGSVPRGAGAKMLVFEDGRSFGTIGGGAAEYRAIQIAKDIFCSKESVMRSFDLGHEQKVDLGMICGGNATVYFQYIRAGDYDMLALAELALSLCAENEDAWLITRINKGEKHCMGIYTKNELHFMEGVSKSHIEPYLSRKATIVGNEYYIEPLVSGGFVYIFGGGHVSKALVPVLAGVNFRPVVFEDRERFANMELFPGAFRTILGDFSSIASQVEITEKDYVAIITRGHQADYQVLRQALKTPARYIGLIGSRSKFAHTSTRLASEGFGNEHIGRIRNPIGIPILAETPEEIAISIAAELILCRAGG